MNNQHSFNIALPDSADTKNIPNLIRWALKEIKKEDGPLSIERFTLVHPYTKADKPSIEIEYSIPTEEEQKLIQETKAWAEEERVSEDLPELEYNSAENKRNISCFIQRLPHGEGQDDAIALLEHTATTIEDLKDAQVLDLIYVDFLDEDVVKRPYVKVYFQYL